MNLNSSSLVTSTEDDPFAWGGDFDQDHQVMSGQDLPLSPVKPMESAEMDPCLSSGHTMKDAEFAECGPGTPDALCSAAEQAKNFKAMSWLMIWLLTAAILSVL